MDGDSGDAGKDELTAARAWTCQCSTVTDCVRKTIENISV